MCCVLHLLEPTLSSADLEHAVLVASKHVAVIQRFVDVDIAVLTANRQETTVCTQIPHRLNTILNAHKRASSKGKLISVVGLAYSFLSGPTQGGYGKPLPTAHLTRDL